MKNSPHPEWALTHKKPGTELRRIKDKYYLYEVSSKWDPEKKRARKITGRLLGRITKENGFVESSKYKLQRNFTSFFDQPLQVKEYGASSFVMESFSEDITFLKQVFPEIWQDIFSLGFIRLLFNPPIKNTAFHFENSFLSELFNTVTLGEKRVSALYRKIGNDRGAVVEYMKAFVRNDDYILFDGTNFVSHSKNIESAKIGYNSKQVFEPQLNVLFLFSSTLKTPVFYRLLPGNIRDVKAFKLTVQEAGIANAVVIADKGFYSADNLETMDTLGLDYVIPLRRSNPQINYDVIQPNDNSGFDGYFEYMKRFIWFNKIELEGRELYLFYDSSLKTKEENDYLTRIQTHPEKYSLEKFKLRLKTFGTVAFISNLKDKSAEEIYKTYKTRGEVETMIDAMKNILKADSSYMQNEMALQGWMFISFMALKWYYYLYNILLQKKLLKRYSPKDILLNLAAIKKIKINQNWCLSEVTSKTQNLIDKLGVHIT